MSRKNATKSGTVPALSEGSFGGRMEPMARPSKYSPELRERAVRLVQEHAPDYPSQWVAIRSVAEKLGCSVEALRRWVRQRERDGGQRPGLTTDERQRLKALEREVVELKRANEILRKASAYFAQAELDRRPKRSWRSWTPTARHMGSSRSVASWQSPRPRITVTGSST